MLIRVGCGSEGKGRSWYWCVMELDTCVGMLCEAAVPTPQYDAHHPKRGEWVCAHGSLAEVLTNSGGRRSPVLQGSQPLGSNN